jgi:hypothetical protein
MTLELVYPPDDGRYTGHGSVYLERDIVESMLTHIGASDLLVLYISLERGQGGRAELATKAQRESVVT